MTLPRNTARSGGASTSHGIALAMTKLRASLSAVLDDILIQLHIMAQSYLRIASKKTELGHALTSGWTSAMRVVFMATKIAEPLKTPTAPWRN
jgi:hypothetical protein